MSNAPPDEALRQVAPLAWRLSGRFCRGCRAYHGLWPWLRLAGVKQGLERDRPQLLPRLAALLAPGGRRLLIAGAADSGLVALCFQAAAGRPFELTLLDRCATPLVISRCFAARHGLSLRTLRADLRTLDRPDGADVILAHSVLGHLPVGDQVPALARLRAALAPEGRLLLVFRLRGEAATPRDLGARLAAAGLEPPGEGAFAEALAWHEAGGAELTLPATLAEAEAQFADGGLAVEELAPTAAASGRRHGFLAVLRAA